MSFKTTILCFLGNMYFWCIDPLVVLYVKIKVRCRRLYRRYKGKYTKLANN